MRSGGQSGGRHRDPTGEGPSRAKGILEIARVANQRDGKEIIKDDIWVGRITKYSPWVAEGTVE